MARLKTPRRLTPDTLEGREVPAAGLLDPTFGAGGQVVTDYNQRNDVVETSVVQPDGKILVVGYTHPDPTFVGCDILVTRYLPDGTPDPAFGTGGRAVARRRLRRVARVLVQRGFQVGDAGRQPLDLGRLPLDQRDDGRRPGGQAVRRQWRRRDIHVAEESMRPTTPRLQRAVNGYAAMISATMTHRMIWRFSKS